MEETEREVRDRELGERAVARMLVIRARAWLGPDVAADDLCPGCGQDAGHDEDECPGAPDGVPGRGCPIAAFSGDPITRPRGRR